MRGSLRKKAGEKKALRGRLSDQLLESLAVDIFERDNIVYDDALIDFVASCIQGPKLHNFLADLGNEATIAGAAGSR